ncbi:MAG: pyridoxine/pyridoxamine 5'-phosphate oxidase [Cyclobacteriaceae bacterium]|nr:MAG: pyridoxine/pyridoxamine 5'-phosphate oxidase [Cyclobacteriaceae bacterium]
MQTDLARLRREYSSQPLDTEHLLPDPVAQFEKWLEEAVKAGITEPNAMTLATVSESGRPSQRVVLLKGIENGQFVFYTNYQSGKGKELLQNPYCALNFFWAELERQVRIEGLAKRVSDEKASEYFRIRPRGAQIGAWASPQSAVIEKRELLEQRYRELEKKFEGREIPRPMQWGGYEVLPFLVEFWQGRPNRLHDRLLYIKDEQEWIIRRLAP